MHSIQLHTNESYADFLYCIYCNEIYLNIYVPFHKNHSSDNAITWNVFP